MPREHDPRTGRFISDEEQRRRERRAAYLWAGLLLVGIALVAWVLYAL